MAGQEISIIIIAAPLGETGEIGAAGGSTGGPNVKNGIAISITGAHTVDLGTIVPMFALRRGVRQVVVLLVAPHLMCTRVVGVVHIRNQSITSIEFMFCRSCRQSVDEGCAYV